MMNDIERKKIADKLLAEKTLKFEMTPLYNDAYLRWRRTVVLPFGGAYHSAYDSVMKAVKDQVDHYDEIEKLKFELAMAALAIAGGSVLTAVYANSALKHAAKETALDFVCKREMQKTFNAMHLVESNPVLSFMGGKVWDTAEGKSLAAMRKAIEPKTGQYKSLGQTLSKPYEIKENIDKFALELRERGVDMLWAIRGLPFSYEVRHALAMNALRSKYLEPPSKELSKSTLIPKVQCTLFMQVLTASDKVEFSRVGRRMRSVPGYRPKNQGPKTFYKDIPQSASGKNYPKASSGNYTRGNVYNTSVTMPGVGNNFMESIDKNHQAVFKKDFFTSGEYWDWSFTGNEVKSIVKRAETTLGDLAKTSHLTMIAHRK